jgi:hypothetical protein
MINAASFQNFLTCTQIILAMTAKSGARHFTISTKKKDLLLRNIVLDKNNPNSKVTAPLRTIKVIIPNHPKVFPKIALATKLKTIARALQIVIGVISIEINLSFLELELLAIITAGTLHPNPVNRLTTLLPLIPNRSSTSSSNTDTLDKTPVCCIKLTQKNKMIKTGIKVMTIKNPDNKPLLNILANHHAVR